MTTRFDREESTPVKMKSLESLAEASFGLLMGSLVFAEKHTLEGEFSEPDAPILKSELIIREYELAKERTLRVFRGFQVVGHEPAHRPSDNSVKEELVLLQARALDEQEQGLAASYDGQYVVFFDGRVLASGGSAEDSLSRVPSDERHLPLVVRKISSTPQPHYMGGPKGV